MWSGKRAMLLVVATGAAVAGVVAAGQAHATRAAAAPTLHLVEKGGGLAVVDNAPKAKHQFDFSPGDIVIVTRNVFEANGNRAGSLRLVCIATTPTAQQCSGTETLTGGTLELAGVSSPAPSTSTAVIGGTGRYGGARGTSISTDRKSNSDVADQTVNLYAGPS